MMTIHMQTKELAKTLWLRIKEHEDKLKTQRHELLEEERKLRLENMAMKKTQKDFKNLQDPQWKKGKPHIEEIFMKPLL